MRAGLVPSLRPSPDWVISEPWTPSDVPLAELSLALAKAAKGYGVELDPARCTEMLRTQGGMADYLRELRGASNLGADTKVLVVMDQAEELVTMTADAPRREFLEALTHSCSAPSPLRVVMTARTDMWDQVSAETVPVRDGRGAHGAPRDAADAATTSRRSSASPRSGRTCRWRTAWSSGWWRTRAAATPCRCWPTR